jgi:hypothetical protein
VERPVEPSVERGPGCRDARTRSSDLSPMSAVSMRRASSSIIYANSVTASNAPSSPHAAIYRTRLEHGRLGERRPVGWCCVRRGRRLKSAKRFEDSEQLGVRRAALRGLSRGRTRPRGQRAMDDDGVVRASRPSSRARPGRDVPMVDKQLSGSNQQRDARWRPGIGRPYRSELMSRTAVSRVDLASASRCRSVPMVPSAARVVATLRSLAPSGVGTLAWVPDGRGLMVSGGRSGRLEQQRGRVADDVAEDAFG